MTGCRTVTMVAPLSHCGPVKYETGHHGPVSLKVVVSGFVCVCAKVCVQGTVWSKSDNTRVSAAHDGESPICRGGVAVL